MAEENTKISILQTPILIKAALGPNGEDAVIDIGLYQSFLIAKSNSRTELIGPILEGNAGKGMHKKRKKK